MATITGSGKFVAIAASNTQLNYLFPTGISGIVFGVNNSPYCRISSRYMIGVGGQTVLGTAFCIDPGEMHDELYLGFPDLAHLKINGYTGYTGTIRVASGCIMNEQTWIETTTYKDYQFKCGLLLNVY